MNGADTIATYPLISAKQQRRFTAKQYTDEVVRHFSKDSTVTVITT